MQTKMLSSDTAKYWEKAVKEKYTKSNKNLRTRRKISTISLWSIG